MKWIQAAAVIFGAQLVWVVFGWPTAALIMGLATAIAFYVQWLRRSSSS